MAPVALAKTVIENSNIESQSHAKTTTRGVSKKKYDFVYNNYPEDLSNIKMALNKYCKRWIFGKEVGAEGTPHLQGFIELYTKDRMTGIIKWLTGCSLRECRNEEALIKYVQKDGNIESKGFPKPIKVITELRPWQKNVVDIINTEPDGRSINWFYDTVGNKGKSALCKYLAVKMNCLIIQGGKLADIMNIIFNTEMEDIKSVIIDVPRCNGNNVSYSSIECILNGMITNTKYETGRKLFNNVHVIVFSNDEPELGKLSADRWKVTDMSVLVPPASPVIGGSTGAKVSLAPVSPPTHGRRELARTPLMYLGGLGGTKFRGLHVTASEDAQFN